MFVAEDEYDGDVMNIDNDKGMEIVRDESTVIYEGNIVDPGQEDEDKSQEEKSDKENNDVTDVANLDDEEDASNEYTNHRPMKRRYGVGVERL